MQRFLLESSVLDRFTPAVAAAVTEREDAAALVRRLVDRHLFTVRLEAGDEESYRYHHLFQAFLRRRLAAQEDPALIAPDPNGLPIHGIVPGLIRLTAQPPERDDSLLATLAWNAPSAYSPGYITAVPHGSSTAQPIQITSGDFSAGLPAWSPDGSLLSFATAIHDTRDLDLHSHVFVVPSTGDWSASGALLIAAPGRAIGLPWARPVRNVAAGLAALFLLGFVVSLVRRPRSRPS